MGGRLRADEQDKDKSKLHPSNDSDHRFAPWYAPRPGD
jgi:hypothetical protein